MSQNHNLKKLNEYQQLLLSFNKRFNLVSKLKTKNLEEDIQDCLELIKLIPQQTKKILDLGSGNGFPGIVIAITKPSLSIDLAEKQNKKAHFLSIATRTLGLKNTKVIQKNIANNTDERYDLVVARAVATTEKILQMTQKIILPQAKYLLMKGKEQKTQEELVNIKKPYIIHPYRLNTKERCIVEIFNQ